VESIAEEFAPDVARIAWAASYDLQFRDAAAPWEKERFGVIIAVTERRFTMFPAFMIQILVVLIIVGLILWAVSQIPMDPTIARVIRVVVVVLVCLWLIYALLGVVGTGPPLYHR
jgi:hypothetical protein